MIPLLDGPDLIIFLATIAGLALVSWLIARRISRHVPELAGVRSRSGRYDERSTWKSHPTDYVPIISARGNRKRDLMTMLALSDRPTSGRQRVMLRKELGFLKRMLGPGVAVTA